ncbi:hypothetical protein SUGI_1016080 [Cryptomeria japonica]|uniref:AT-hook motif nuclear-localized protein 14-like isoform X1 n=1 Tax=Cryptomeria japonica TaxID=3369 RepID=UPI00241477A6|nr:AT-hook motif nuclear-localized protein 14-like isoform X1 [Cryptomeria japonica]GLJ48121.1 hypothetical protein SUGI_1016080 [Cryptomeria japonica]
MEEQGTGGDQAPLYSEFYDNSQQLLNHNFNLQQQHEIAPFNGASNYNGTAHFNGESHNNNSHHLQEQAQRRTLQQEQFQMVRQTQLQRNIQQQRQLLEMETQQALLLQYTGRSGQLYNHADNQNGPFNVTLQQNQNVNLQSQQNHNVNVHPHQQHDVEMQFQQRQNMEMDIQQIQLLQQHDMEQSKNVNMNVISQPTETVTDSLPITLRNGEKRKRGRPRKLCNHVDNRASRPPLGSTKTPQGLQFEYGEPALFRVIVIAPGEDVHEKIMSFYQQTPLTVCIISAKGTICNVDILEIESRRIVNHKGEFEILSLSHSYTKENNGIRVTLVHPDGKIFKGIVGGLLIAASCVEVFVGVFSSNAVYISGEVGDKGPYIDNVRALTTEFPISISGQPNTEAYSANGTNEGNLQQTTRARL